jgi:Tol biopolymer transport system component/C-terminal processing protease CtpA/Prc
MKKNLLTLIIGISFCFQVIGQEVPLWMRYPALSPDGKNIVFSYQGDLYKVETSGGLATPLTLHEAHDYMPVWSHDGTKIAFASNRYGNFDVYIMPSTGGKAERLTYHSSSDFPTDFSSDDGSVLFYSSRLDAASNQQYPSGVLSELYQIPTIGGKAKQILTTPSQDTKVSLDGSLMVFHDRKGYEDAFRKHHTSSVTRDVWKYETASGKYTQLTNFEGEDRNPVFAPNQNEIYFLSEEKGSFNVYKMDLNNPSQKTQITFLENHPVRYLSISKDGLLCFSYNGEIYTKKGDERANKVNIQIASDSRYNTEKILSVNKNATEMALSPNGKELAFVHRGEVFVSSIKEGTTKRITNTPEQERNISFSPDGKSILYASERNGSWNLYQTSLAREEEKYFFNSTILNEETILDSPKEEFQPAYSPDGKEVAYLEERTAIKVINLKSKEVREIMAGDKNYSYADGDQHFAWSPDGKWFLVEFLQDKQWISQAGLISAKGGEIHNLTQSGYNNSTPRWSRDGKMMIWFSDRDGMKNDASWGGESDVYGMFFTQEGYDKYKLNKEEYELSKEDKEEDDDEETEEKEVAKKDDEEMEPIKIELDGIEDRKVRLSVHSSRLADAVVSKDGEKLYYLSRFEKGYDLWETNLRTRESKVLSKLGASSVGDLILDKEGKNLFVLANGKISKIGLDDSKKKSVGMKGEMVLNEMEEREYLFEHIWRQVEKKFYKVDLHEVKWDFYKNEYARFLPHINNNHDFAEMLSELLGELNASHTGARYRPKTENGDATAALGLFYDNNFDGDGLKIEEVMDKSPVVNKDSKIKAGVIIEKIDGNEITKNTNPYKFLNRKTGKYTLLSLYDPAKNERWEETVKPISLGAENQLQYQRWVKNCREIVEEASGGKIGYVHVRGMNDRSYRTVYEEVLGKNHGKDALIVDTRFNGGGWLHDDLATFLDGKNYMTFMPRGQDLGNEPQFKWSKPSIVVMGESNYSDAHMFPYTYRALGIGKLLGMPVPGTGTAVWWETLQNGMVFGIPQVGMVGPDGEYLENNQLEPDVKVMNEPGKVSKGQDQQLEEAVKELLKVVKP